MKKYVMITGGSRGIGLSVASYFLKNDYSLILVSKNITSLLNAKLYLHQTFPSAEIDIYNLDLSIPSYVINVFDEILSRYPKLDVLVNSAGILTHGNINLSYQELLELINVNLLSTIMVTNLVAKKMKLQGFGHIFNLGSTAGLDAVPKIAAYSATKSAIVSYSQSLYKELLPFNIKVCCLCPSVVDTDMTNDGRIDNATKIQVDDLAKSIDYIINLSDYATIAVLPIRCTTMDLL
ncbi:SDR family NAD(P)-dependent oxidoreductase [Photobacterium leiognathi]|uniref:SDR family NAD(P)-dependent oxidoreductase n=1 Tax=Photobacterium leiognathi TaxID=553611 RepID=UPI0029817149|nr:SDR family NAD(P)-dependent oxidoreductase [Photobacterium leiognathi]